MWKKNYTPWKNFEDTNCSTMFLLPMTGKLVSDFYPYGFVNTFIGDEERMEETYGKLLVLIHKTNSLYRQSYHSFVRKLNGCEDIYQIEKDLEYLVFPVKKEWHYVMNLFIEGKYSYFGKDYGEEFIPIIDKTTNRISLARKVLDKGEDAFKYVEHKYDISIPREQEAWSKPKPKNEIIRWKKLKQFPPIPNN
jgi:hypothetical protein